MLQLFRKFFASTIGIAVTMGFLVLIALAFAGADVSSSGSFGGIGGGDRVAKVGGTRIGTGDFQRKVTDALEQLRQRDPKLTMANLISQGGLEDVLANQIDVAAMREFAKAHGIAVSDRLIDSEIAKLPGIQGPDGRISDQNYHAFLAARRMNDAQLRDEISTVLLARQLLGSTEIGATLPKAAVLRYAGLLTETRSGEAAEIPSAAFAPKTPPSQADIASYFASHRAQYSLPERRVIRYATFTDAALKSVPAPTEAEIAARYAADKDKYAAAENRRIAQLVLPTEAAAKEVAAEVAGGKSLEEAAKAKGLAVASLSAMAKPAYTQQTTASVADAVFAAPTGKLLGPLKGSFGWLLVRVDGIEGKPGKSLDQARGEIIAALSVTKRRAALADFAAKIEDEFDHGTALGDVAKELGVSVSETRPLTADGRVFGSAGEQAPPVLAKVVPAAFAMVNEKQPQLAEVEPGKTFAIYDVGAIAAAAPPPLESIAPRVATDLTLSRGVVGARAAALQVEAAARRGVPLAQALAALKISLPPVRPIPPIARLQLEALKGRVPPPLAALFAGPKGGARLVTAPDNQGFVVVAIKTVSPGAVKPDDPRLAGLTEQLGKAHANELSEELRNAMRKEVGVTRNEKAIASVKAALLGTGNTDAQ